MNDAGFYGKFVDLSPFEIKDELMRLAQADTSGRTYLNAGRGNPNWIATRAREAFFLLGQFALTEAKRVMNDEEAGLAGMPPLDGCHKRLKAWVEKRKGDPDTPGAETLEAVVDFAITKLRLRPGQVRQRADQLDHRRPLPGPRPGAGPQRGDHPRVPDVGDVRRPPPEREVRPLPGRGRHRGHVLHLQGAEERAPAQRRRHHRHRHADLHPLPRDAAPRGLCAKTIHVASEAEDRFQLTDDDLKALEDKTVKALFLVNPGNPSAVAIDPEAMQRLVGFVKAKRPDLMILTDDVYGTFVPDFESVMGHLPHNTIGVYSFSKYFGCTGWRLGVVAVAQDNIFDKMIRAQPEATQKLTDARYKAMTPHPREVKFIDRIVADSRDVALNHTAGLSLPQQVMMSLFGLVEMMDEAKVYQKACMAICERRFRKLFEGMGIEITVRPYFDRYYGIIDYEYWARKQLGDEVVDWVKANIHPLDIPFKLAEDHGIVLLNGSGFEAPNWSVRVSFANLPDDAYESIGRAVRAVARGYLQAYRAAKGEPVQP